MFDVFDIQLPEISTTTRLEVRQQETAFGISEDRYAYVDGTKFAKVVAPRAAYRDVKAWMGSRSRSNWTVLLAADVANSAAADDETWARFIDALGLVLSSHVGWRVTCESDCDQYPIENLELSAEGLSALLDRHRRTGARSIAFRATSHGL